MVGGRGGQKRKAANQQPVCGHDTDEGRKIAVLEKELGRVKKRLKTADEELREYLRISLISKDKEIESVKKDMLLVQSKNKDLIAEKASLEESTKELEANQSELMGSHSKMSSTLNTLKKEVYDIKNNNSQLSATNSKLQHKAEQNKEKITQLQKDKLRYEKSNKLLHEQIRDERMALVSCQAKYSALDETRQAEEKTVQDMMTTFKSLQCGIKELEASILEKEKQINESDKANSKLSTDYASLLIKYNKNEDNNSALRVENQSSMAYASLQEKYNDIKRTYEDRTNALQAASLSLHRSIEKDKQSGNTSTILQENKEKINQLLKDHKLIEQKYKESILEKDEQLKNGHKVLATLQEKQTALDQTCKSLQEASLAKDELIRKAKAEAETIAERHVHEIHLKDDQYRNLYFAHGQLFEEYHALKNSYSQLLDSHSTLQRSKKKKKTKKTQAVNTNNEPRTVQPKLTDKDDAEQHTSKVLNAPKLIDIKFSPINRPSTHEGDFTNLRVNANDVLLESPR